MADADLNVIAGDGLNDAANTGEQVTHGITTAWIKLAGLQGFKRIRRLGILGRLVAPDGYTPSGFVDVLGDVVITVAYNYDAADIDTYTIAVRDLYVAGQMDPLHLRVRLARQKCAAIKVGVSYVPRLVTGEPIGNPASVFFALDVTGLALEVGLKKGIRKVGHAGGVNVS